MKIILLEPFYTASHAQWADSLVKYSKHDIELLTLPGRNWKWRMHGGAVSLVQKYNNLSYKPDIIIATDMLDLNVFLSLTRQQTTNIPVALYFHENQLAYPWSKNDQDVALKRDAHYAFINYTSALSADKIFFNSAYNMNSFINELKDFLKSFPDYNEIDSIKKITAKSQVLAPGLDLKKFDKFRLNNTDENEKIPLILWNHRWEYDKNPEDFFNALFVLKEKNIQFKLAVIGEEYQKSPQIFKQARQRLSEEIVQFGYVDSFKEYAKWLWKADIIPMTSIQEFFGISLMEALYCETIPILPNRLTYPDLVDFNKYSDYFYHDFEGLVNLLEKTILNIQSDDRVVFRNIASRYDWSQIIENYDSLFLQIISK